jgi:hypothetical protein
MIRTPLFALAMLAVASPAIAQTSAPAPERKQILTTNPLILVGGFLNVEYERKVSEGMTAGFTAASFDGFYEGAAYRNVTFIARYYPQEGAPKGFYFGGKAGLHHVEAETVFGADDNATVVGLGFDLGYTWILGRPQRFVVGLGGGATRLFGDELDGASFSLVNIRINVGIAF